MEAKFADRWAMLGRGEITPPESSIGSNSKMYYKPLSEAVDEFVHWAQHPNERIYLGFPELDAQIRGIAAGEMCLINGYSHSGKTLFLLQILVANADKPVVYFCPDEPRTLTLVKLACVLNGIDANLLEDGVSRSDPEALDILKDTASKHFPKLAVFDQFMSLSDMEKAMGEVMEMWGKPALIVFDYLELLNGGGEDVPSKANTLKAFGKRHNVPLLVLHQSSRTAGADGKKMTISSGAYGGEQQASHIIGVRRKKFEIEGQIREIEQKLDRSAASEKMLERLDQLRYELRIHQFTLTVNLVKCKRPASMLLDDIDFEIEAGTGRLTQLPHGYFPEQYQSQSTPAVDTPPTEEYADVPIFDDDWFRP